MVSKLVLQKVASFVGILLFIFVIAPPVAADYLEVRRSATIKEEPNRDAEIINRPEIGTHLQLLDEGVQVNGYYRVLAPLSERPGWIYRTLVRRFPGDISVLPSSDSSLPIGLVDETGPIMKAHFIDVGQGDATLLEFSCGAILIDAGGQNRETTNNLIDYLEVFFERRPDLSRTLNSVFITHTHDDHYHAIKQVAQNFTVQNFIYNGDLNGSASVGVHWVIENSAALSIQVRPILQTDVSPASRNQGLGGNEIDPINCPLVDPNIRILAGPYVEKPGDWTAGAFGNQNNKSLVIKVEFGNSSFLFTGDLETHGINTLVDYYQGTETLDIDVYQAGHHGADNGTNNILLNAITPEIAVFSMSDWAVQGSSTAWAYGHPRREIVVALDNRIDRPRPNPKQVIVGLGSKDPSPYPLTDALFGTGWDGSIVITADQMGNYAVTTER